MSDEKKLKILAVTVLLPILSFIVYLVFLYIADSVIITKEYNYIGGDTDYKYYWDNNKVKKVYNDTNVFVVGDIIKINEEEYVDNWKSVVLEYSAYTLVISLLSFLILAVILTAPSNILRLFY